MNLPYKAKTKFKKVAGRLLAFEAAQDWAGVTSGFRVCEKLREPVGKMLGVDALRSLMSRALVLGCAEDHSLWALKINPDGSLGHVEFVNDQPDPEVAAVGEMLLVAHVLGALATHLGLGPTREILQKNWPEVDLQYLDSNDVT